MDCADFDAGGGRRIAVNTATRARLLAEIESRLADRKGFSVATLNLDHLVKLRRFRAFREAYARHSHVVADGNPIVWISRLEGRSVDLIPGCELVHPVARLAADRGVPVAFLGSRETTLERAAERLERRHPGLEVAARISPSFGFDPFGMEADACIEALRRSGARICFLALGAPKQEVFAARAQAALPEVGFLSIGAGLDFLAGTQKRAPLWMRRWALEWLWRAVGDPKRLAMRYVRCAMLMPGLTMDGLRRRLTRRPSIPAEGLAEA